ncbi:probable purine permease 11 isoform X1 [Chenopodium quinoa]|nr:probable purine permease 11 isoform X1 [Chenopodium quinoa]
MISFIMEATQDLAHQTIGTKEDGPRSNLALTNLKHYKMWLRIIPYILFLLIGQTTGILLGRLYFDKGGNSKWMATFVQTAGFPILIPLKLFLVSSPTSLRPPVYKLTLLYFVYGLLVAGDNLMYSYGLLYLPVSTYSLLCASQLAFNAVTSFFINAQKFTALVLNSLVILTISACLIAINADNEANTSNNTGKGKFALGFLCTLGASAALAFNVSVAQYSFEKVIKDNSLNTVVCMQLYPFIVATCVCVIGLFGSGEWHTLNEEMRNYKMGGVSYVLTLTFTAISWQLASLGMLGLIFEVSSLFSNVIATFSLPLVPIFAVVFFHDKMNGVKVISMILAMWGFLSYIYQHYLDDIEAKKATKVKLDASTELF